MTQLLTLFHFAANGCGTHTGLLPSLYDGLCPSGSSEPSIGALSNIGLIIGNIVRILMAISGSLAIVVILVAAVFYVTSAGDPSRVKRAKEILLNTVLGLVLIIAAYAILTFIAGEF